MEAGSFLIHCMPYLEAPARRYEQALSLNGQRLTPGGVYTENFAQSLWEANGHQFILVVPDATCEKRPLSHRLFAAMTKEPVSGEKFEALYDIFEGRAETNVMSVSTGKNINLLHSKADTKAEYAAFSAITLFPLFYLSLTLAMTAATVLTIQQLCETERYRRQFSLLGKLGMDKKEMRQALLKQLAIYYTLPSIPPVMIALPVVLHMGNATEPGALTGASSPPAILGFTLGLFFLMYFLYIILAYNSLRRNVLN